VPELYAEFEYHDWLPQDFIILWMVPDWGEKTMTDIWHKTTGWDKTYQQATNEAMNTNYTFSF